MGCKKDGKGKTSQFIFFGTDIAGLYNRFRSRVTANNGKEVIPGIR